MYALRSSAIKTMDLGLLYRALEDGQVTMIAANATDGLLSKLDVKVLDDDKHAFPPYELCIAAREDRLAAVPGLRAAFAELYRQIQRSQNAGSELSGRRQTPPGGRSGRGIPAEHGRIEVRQRFPGEYKKRPPLREAYRITSGG